jgi:hypothetical protein
LSALSRLYYGLNQVFPEPSDAKDLLQIAFCRLLIEKSNADFGHQSMSFKEDSRHQSMLFPNDAFVDDEEDVFLSHFSGIARQVILAAATPVPGHVRVIQADSRRVPTPAEAYNGVITSPPYPNRMSYIRELRPYMYWLGYLRSAREAGDLDWQAIGGTWGVATSRVGQWVPEEEAFHDPDFDRVVAAISARSQLLGKYVHKYFTDMATHFDSIYDVLSAGAKVFYIVGNSKFYDTIVPTERFYMRLLEQQGFVQVELETLRKRTSKSELFEYIVSARKP